MRVAKEIREVAAGEGAIGGGEWRIRQLRVTSMFFENKSWRLSAALHFTRRSLGAESKWHVPMGRGEIDLKRSVLIFWQALVVFV